MVVLENSKYLENIPKITNHTRECLISEFSISELVDAINASKLNKAQVWTGMQINLSTDELKFWIYRYSQEAILNTISEIALDGIIAYILK